MKIKSLLAIAIMSACSLSAQRVFEKGYYVDNSGKRVDGFLESVDFERINSPESVVVFKTDEGGEITRVKASDIFEVGIGNDMKFKKFTVEIDNANLYNVTTTQKHPVYETKTVFLNVLVEGVASLLVFEDSGGNKYFYQIKGKMTKPEQLIYKKFQFSRIELPRENTSFRQQLFDHVSCEGDSFKAYSDLKYEKNELLRIFETYNQCHGDEFIRFENKTKTKAKILASLFVGMNSNKLKVDRADPAVGAANSTFVDYGVEFEILTSARKWGIFTRFSGSKISAETQVTYVESQFTGNVRTDIYEMNITTFDLMLGGRRHFNYTSKHSFSADAAFGTSLVSGDAVQRGKTYYPVTDSTTDFLWDSYKPESSMFLSLGVGYMYAHHYGIGLRFDTSKTVVDAFQEIKMSYSKMGISLTYTF